MTLDPKRNPTLRDIKMGKVEGKFDNDIVDLALESNPIAGHFVITTANNGENNTTTIRTGFPDGTWVGYYDGVQPTKGTKKQVTDSAGKLKHLIQVDKDLIEESGDEAAEMGDEAFSHAEAMTQEICECFFYGNTKVNGKKFNGLGPIYSELCTANSTNKEAAYYTLGAKRSASPDATHLRSIWLVGWGRMGTHLFAPKGTTLGLERGPVTERNADLANGKGVVAVKEQFFKWTVGMTCKDFRCNVRIANIELNNIETLNLDLGDLMLQALTRARKVGVSQKFYMSPQIYEWLVRKARKDKIENGFFSFKDYEGEQILHFQGIPIFKLDCLETNETAVTAAA